MEDVGFTDDMNDQDGESVGMAEKDDADLSFQKHTGDYYSYNVKQINYQPLYLAIRKT